MVPVPPVANPLDDPDDAAAYARYCDALLDAVVLGIPAWAATVSGGVDVGTAGAAMQAEVAGALGSLLDADVEAQRTNPLSILRQAAHHVTTALAAAGVPEVERDADARRLFPDDVYDLGPAAFADLGETVHDAGLTWGAAKAHLVLRRHR
jgi:hypothetical protein